MEEICALFGTLMLTDMDRYAWEYEEFTNKKAARWWHRSSGNSLWMRRHFLGFKTYDIGKVRIPQKWGRKLEKAWRARQVELVRKELTNAAEKTLPNKWPSNRH